MTYLAVAVDVGAPGTDRPFTYRLPPHLDPPEPGTRVLIPFGPRRTQGVVLGVLPRADREPVKDILGIAAEAPVPGDLLELHPWIAERYLCYLPQAVGVLLPPPRVERPDRDAPLELLGPPPPGPARARLAQALAQGPRTREELEALGVRPSTWRDALRRGWVRTAAAPRLGAVKAGPKLEPQQAACLEAVRADLGHGGRFLLHGVTGSGKTEVYLGAISACLDAGRGAIVLVPEIALTPQTVERFRSRLPGGVEVLHSALAPGERYGAWQRLRSGLSRVVVGARSAVFAPVAPLGLIIVDEEHETTYKQEDSPRYHAREVAEERARRAGATLLLGSATPSVESYLRAERGELHRLRLPRRVQGARLPRVELVDLRRESRQGLLSRRLELALVDALARGEQAILFLNRRGLASVALCRECGYAERCRHCDVSLTVHGGGRLICHYCGELAPWPTRCPGCGGNRLRPLGAGTERLEAEIAERFPHARVLRMDMDTTRPRGAVEAIDARFRSREADILIGTQMVAKGLDFPGVSLVGVIVADQSLRFPDFRAEERTFQLLTQVAGRAGRAATHGRVLVQTFSPDHPVIQLAASQDAEAFYRREIAARIEKGYPPARHLVRIVAEDPDPGRARGAIGQFARALAGEEGMDAMGPAPALIARIKDRHRFQLLLFSHDGPQLRAAVRRELLRAASDRVRLMATWDPLHLF